MEIMLICHADQVRVEITRIAPYLAQLPHNFTLSPLVTSRDKNVYNSVISQLILENGNIHADPIFLKSPNMSFINLLNPRVLFNDFRSLFNLIKRVRPQVIVCYYVMHAYPLVMLKKFFKFSLCLVAMGNDINVDNSPLQRFAKKLIFNSSDLIFACSRILKDKIKKEYRHNAVLVPSSANTSFFRPLDCKTKLRAKWNFQPGRLVILNVSLFDKVKAIDLLIRSLKKIDSENIDLLLVGDGQERKSLEQLSISLGLQKRVTFLGFREKEELLELYNLSDVFAMISYSEGLPRALIEAMACGCIPIVTKVGSMPSIVSNGFNGFVINPGDIEKFVQEVKEVSSLSEEKKKLMQVRARKAVQFDFDSKISVKKMYERINALYS